MRLVLILLFCFVLAVMSFVTIRASMVRNVFDNGELLRDPWFIATLCDAYFGFMTFSIWVAYKERSMLMRLLWLVAVLFLGNFAIATYVLIQLFRLRKGQPVSLIFQRGE
jgi:hypothetical protein